MTYTPDLELRRRVAEAYYGEPITHKNGYWLKEHTDMGGDVGKSVVEVPAFDTSFDAILPLVRKLWKDSANIAPLIHAIDDICPFKHPELDMEWLIYEATPADYCRAYLSAKGETNVWLPKV